MIHGYKVTATGVRFHTGVLVGRGVETSVDKVRHKLKMIELDPDSPGTVWLTDEKGRSSLIPTGTVSQIFVTLEPLHELKDEPEKRGPGRPKVKVALPTPSEVLDAEKEVQDQRAPQA